LTDNEMIKLLFTAGVLINFNATKEVFFLTASKIKKWFIFSIKCFSLISSRKSMVSYAPF